MADELRGRFRAVFFLTTFNIITLQPEPQAKDQACPSSPHPGLLKLRSKRESQPRFQREPLPSFVKDVLLISAAEKGRALEHKQGAPELMLSPE